MKRLYLLVLLLTFPCCKTQVTTTSACGDGILDSGEGCDGAALSVQRCTDLGYYEQQGELVCLSDCSLDLTVCSGTCGDGIIQTGFAEQCEGADLGGNSCLSLQLGEGTLTCASSCRLDTSGCELGSSCGDGIIDPYSEDCDGPALDGQTCGSLGQYPGALACSSCTWDFTGCGGTCGDGALQEEHEACDETEFGAGTCREHGFFSGHLVCAGDCTIDPSGCANATEVTGGFIHTCAVLENGGVRCWGANNNSQLGTGDGLEHPTPAAVALLSSATVVSSGNSHTCALQGGAVACWGDNHEAQIGDGTTNQAETPVFVQMNEFLALEAGLYHTCAVRSGGAVWCWGDNDYRQVSQTAGDQPTPVLVSGLGPAQAVAAGEHHTCALLADGAVWCWGRNDFRQMGNAFTVAVQATPAAVAGLAGVTRIAAGNGHTCALLGDGTVRCWGRNDQGQLGNGTTVQSTSTPVAVSGLTGAASLSGGAFFTCAALLDGTVRCWGDNGYGQLGNGSTTDSSSPVSVQGLSAVTALGLGDSHACAVLAGMIWCWGYNEEGETGDGTTGNNRLTPVQTLP